jgi:hypothetical protein
MSTARPRTGTARPDARSIPTPRFRVTPWPTSGSGWNSPLVKNAFKETYYNGGIGFASLFTLNIVVPGEPRTYMLEARYRF